MSTTHPTETNQTQPDDRNVPEEDIQDLFTEYFGSDNRGRADVGDLAEKYPRSRISINVDIEELMKLDCSDFSFSSGDIDSFFADFPETVFECAHEALMEASLDLPVQIEDSFEEADIRFVGVHEAFFKQIRDLRSEHANSFIGVSGTVRQSSEVKPKIQTAVYECTQCEFRISVPQHGPTLQEPYECPGCERNGPFELRFSESEFSDAQVLRVQETQDHLRGSETPEDLRVDVSGDLCGAVSPGDTVSATGILRMEEPTGSEPSRFFDKYLQGNNIQRKNKTFEDLDISDDDKSQIEQIAADPSTHHGDYDDLYKMLRDSIAPTIWGYSDEKMGILLQLFGGVTKHNPDNSVTRGDFHILLIGDPGTGKSAIIQYIEEIAPRSVYASGKGTSTAGLTAAAVQKDMGDGSEWTLEAGALVLADKGIASIDELDKMSPEDRSALHEGLEQQKISIAKAGISAELQSRCALLAAANPKYGNFDEYEAIVEQIDLEPALISRFDLIFTITDKPDEETDSRLADHIITGNRVGQVNTHETELGESVEDAHQISEEDTETVTPPVSPELFQKYVAYAKNKIYPYLTDEAESELEDFYVDLRTSNGEDSDAIPVTARKLEGLVRLAEASARIRLSNTIELEDANRAIRIVKASLNDVGVDPESGEFDSLLTEAGTSTTQENRIKRLGSIIEEMEHSDEYNDGVPQEDIVEKMVESGSDEQKVEHEIEAMKTRGELYEPSNGKLLTT